jgi:hypothetical protein
VRVERERERVECWRILGEIERKRSVGRERERGVKEREWLEGGE